MKLKEGIIIKKTGLKIFLAASAVLMFAGCHVYHGHSVTNSVRAAEINPNRNRNHNYKIRTAYQYRLRVVSRDGGLYRNPGGKMIKSTKSLKNRLVRLNYKAEAAKRPTYYQVNRLGKNLGWIKSRNLSRTSYYKLPYKYTSQFWPSAANDACEAAALKMGLSSLGKAKHTSLRTMVKRIPRSNNPEKGYTRNPFKYGTGATIYPGGLGKIARTYGVGARSITGASKSKLIWEVRHGNPVIFEGSYMMRETGSDHSLTLLGYKPGYFFFADPLSHKSGARKSGWVSTSRFMKIFSAKKRGRRALVIYPK